jgi:hypothetical protein
MIDSPESWCNWLTIYQKDNEEQDGGNTPDDDTISFGHLLIN